MKTKIEVQFMNKDVNVTDIEKLVKRLQKIRRFTV